jgi:hypothetical protein
VNDGVEALKRRSKRQSLVQEDDKKPSKAEQIAKGQNKVGGDGEAGEGDGKDSGKGGDNANLNANKEEERVHILQPKYYQDLANNNKPGMRTTFYSQHHQH